MKTKIFYCDKWAKECMKFRLTEMNVDQSIYVLKLKKKYEKFHPNTRSTLWQEQMVRFFRNSFT